MRQVLTLIGAAAGAIALAVGIGACGANGATPASDAASDDLPAIVVTTNLLGDVVSSVVGDLAEIEVIMPLGADPHDFAPSAKQAESMENAELLVINGAGFEQGMDGVIDSVADGGTEVFAFADAIDLLDTDPHLWTDPTRIVAGVESLAAALAVVEGIDTAALDLQAAAYVAELEALDAEIEAALDAVPADDRVLVTNHEVLAYFADRYGFELVGAVVPSLTTAADTSARALEDLAEVIEAEDIPAIFAETTQSTALAEALADEVGGDIAIVQLFTESLGEPGSGAETYIDLMRTNAELIAGALAGT